ncbi:leukocyte elastase inhibitor-like isoform X1 [Zophobas morio]|uniref:leukocyte elastase inhibitor-like isoform X1 n=1 Tax=Zophobas morio TaxID=2755281 RepID=UPI003082B354
MSNTSIPAAVRQIVQGNSAFTLKLYKILSKQPGNVFFSPFSVHTALAMLHQGARQDTATILGKVLQIPEAESTAEGYKWIINQLKSIQSVILRIANKIYVKDDEEFVKEFQNTVKEYFYSDLESFNYGNRRETVHSINEWVEEQTSGKIRKVVSESSITKDTSLFLVNAIYFKGDWLDKFTKSRTTKEPFYLDDQQMIQVEMMNGTKKVSYKFDDKLNAGILRLAYKRREIQMVIILPKERNGIKDLEDKLWNVDFADVINKDLCGVKANLSLPKFKFSTSMDLEGPLKEMGLDIIFNKEKADFKGMLVPKCERSLSVDKIFQKAYIDVNEEGSEAAAVTVVRVMMGECARKERIIDFVVDHPAIFMLVQSGTQDLNILFCGRLYQLKYH